MLKTEEHAFTTQDLLCDLIYVKLKDEGELFQTFASLRGEVTGRLPTEAQTRNT